MDIRIIIYLAVCFPIVVAALVVILEAVIFIRKENKKKRGIMIVIAVMLLASSCCGDKQQSTQEEGDPIPIKPFYVYDKYDYFGDKSIYRLIDKDGLRFHFNDLTVKYSVGDTIN